jgi:hypothetical protein
LQLIIADLRKQKKLAELDCAWFNANPRWS